MKYGKLIVIEGGDGAGKKTQADLLLASLEKQGYDVAFYDFPQYEESFFGRMVGRYLNGEFGQADDVSPYLASLLFAGDRFQASQRMKKDLGAGKIIVTNRNIQSNICYQIAKMSDPKEKKKFLEWLKELEYEVYQIPRANQVIYLHVPHAVGKELVAKKAQRSYTEKTHDIHEANEDFLERVEKEYLEMAKNNAGWWIVKCIEKGELMSVENIHQKVLEVVKEVL